MSHSRASWSGLVAAVAILSACDSPTRPRSLPLLEVRSASAPSPFLHTLDVTAPQPSAVQVEYWTEGGPRVRKVIENPGTEHELLLTRLLAGRTYQYEVRALGRKEQLGPVTAGVFSTEPLPEALRRFRFTATGTPSSPLTAIELWAVGYGGLLIVDPSGEVVWHFPMERQPTGATRLKNGNFVINDREGQGLVQVNPRGEIVSTLPQDRGGADRWVHHEVISTPRNTVLAISEETRTFGTRKIVGDAIWEWDPVSGAASKRWSSFDHLDPMTDWGPYSIDADWIHANSLAIGPGGNILLSSRSLNEVISISPDFRSVEWRLGGPKSTFQIPADARWYTQHTAAELAPVGGKRRVLMFDNGFLRDDAPKPYSRALELELDTGAKTVRKVWEFRPERDNYASIMSSAYRLENGNTFLFFGTSGGMVGSSGPTEAYEVTPGGTVRWHLQLEHTHGIWGYRAWPLQDIDGEKIVQGSR